MIIVINALSAFTYAFVYFRVLNPYIYLDPYEPCFYLDKYGMCVCMYVCTHVCI